MNRRQALLSLRALPAFAAGAGLMAPLSCRNAPAPAAGQGGTATPLLPARPVANQPSNFNPSTDALLEELRLRGARYFVERADPRTGLVLDRARADGAADPQATVASVAATGFALSALCMAADHEYLAAERCAAQIEATLRYLALEAPHVRGFFPHFLHARTGQRMPGSEYSSMDTALLLAGALDARVFLNSAKTDALVRTLYERVDWPWMLSPGPGATLSMGWLPESGFLKARWDSYSECMLMYLLAIGSPTHPLPAAVWPRIQRNTYDYGGIRFISSLGALFIHQYPHVWLDLRDRHDGYTDYFQNSISAIRAHKVWCMLQHGRFSWIDERTWGFSASDTPRERYAAWAAPPEIGEWDGTLAPHAAGGSLPLMPDEAIVVLRSMREHFPQTFGHYGFANAFNPGAQGGKGWIDPQVIAIDLALTALMAENQQTDSVRGRFMRNPEIVDAMRAVGFRATVR